VPVEITSGELFRVEVDGVEGLQLTRMEYNNSGRRYYSFDGYELRDGWRAAIGEQGGQHEDSSCSYSHRSRRMRHLRGASLYAKQRSRHITCTIGNRGACFSAPTRCAALVDTPLWI
jgi:hypothetical protein